VALEITQDKELRNLRRTLRGGEEIVRSLLRSNALSGFSVVDSEITVAEERSDDHERRTHK
jgi:hypothetical protein